LVIIPAIVLGQILIVTIGGKFFGVEPIGFNDWIFIILITSPVLLFSEACRALKRFFSKKA
jgi:hypothetical protein